MYHLAVSKFPENREQPRNQETSCLDLQGLLVARDHMRLPYHTASVILGSYYSAPAYAGHVRIFATLCSPER